MLNLVGDIVKYFSFDDVNVDNWVFKLFYKGAFIILLMGSMVGITSQYFGEPINCDFKGIDNDMASDYCWIHGSPHMPANYLEHTNCAVDQDKFTSKESEEDVPPYDTSYYQWVTFVLLFQAGSFMLPYKIWKALEGGLIEQFGLEAKSGIILKEENDHGESLDSLVEKYVLYYKSIFHRNQWYFGKYIFCEILNVVILGLNFHFIDVFLSGNFWYYGWLWIGYNGMSYGQQQVSTNPLCNTFPLEVSCSVPNFGAGGGIQELNGMCVLTQNIINQKMYLVIWFYMVFLISILPVCIFYRVLTLFFDYFRSALLIGKEVIFFYFSQFNISQFSAQLGNTNDKKARKAIKEIMSKCHVGDWFVLFQLSKNVNMYFFRAFVKELAKSLKLTKRSSQRSNQPKITYIEKEKVDNHLPSGPLLGPKKIPDDDSDDDYIDDDVEQGASSNCSSIKKTPRPPPPL